MSNRLDQDRERELAPTRREYAKKKITELGFEITFEDDTRLEFMFNGSTVKLFFYSGWHTGKTITDGRGVGKLLNQIKKI